MTVSADLYYQNFRLPQGNLQPKPPTLASAATIAPTHCMVFVTGTVQVATITPPQDGAHILWLIFTDAAPGALLTTGNIFSAYTPVQNRPFALLYDPSTAKYYPMAVA